MRKLFLIALSTLGLLPFSPEITNLKAEGKTKFSKNIYVQEFGEGSFASAKEVLTAIANTEVLLSTIERRRRSIKDLIGEDERSMWQYAVRHDLLPLILKSGMITEQELEAIKDYVEHSRIRQNLTEEIFNTFTIAVASVA